MNLYIDAEQAAAELGVSVATLYTYISRRGIRSQQVPGTKKRQYWSADIDRLKTRKNKGRPTNNPGSENNSELTLLTPEGPYYRGQSAIELSETQSLEDVAALLWNIDSNIAFRDTAATAPTELRSLYKVFKHTSIADKAIGILPFVERANPRAFDLSHEGMCRTGADLMRWYAAILSERETCSSEPLHIQTAALCGGEDDIADLIRRVLVISADHGFGAGTYAIRAVASEGVTPYRSVLSGFAIAPGRRNVLGHRAGIARLLSELDASHDPEKVLARRMEEGDDLPGFRIPWPYLDGDPRVKRVVEDLRRVRGDHPFFVKMERTFIYAEQHLGRHPGFGMLNDVIARIIGLPSREFLYPLGRCAGWVAHSIEQYQAGEVEPPVANYRGLLPKQQKGSATDD